LGEINVPLVFLGQPDVVNLKLPRAADARRNTETADINQAHAAER
jgi:hypothetical protein